MSKYMIRVGRVRRAKRFGWGSSHRETETISIRRRHLVGERSAFRPAWVGIPRSVSIFLDGKAPAPHLDLSLFATVPWEAGANHGPSPLTKMAEIYRLGICQGRYEREIYSAIMGNHLLCEADKAPSAFYLGRARDFSKLGYEDADGNFIRYLPQNPTPSNPDPVGNFAGLLQRMDEKTTYATYSTADPVGDLNNLVRQGLEQQPYEEDPYTEEPQHCKICGKEIEVAELCEECAVGNDPFFTSKYR